MEAGVSCRYTVRNMIFPQLTLELARRVERSESQAAVEGAETLLRLRPESGAAVESMAGGHAVYCGANSPVTQAVGLGLDGPVSDTEFARLEDFYFSRNEPVRVETCPLADASLLDHFARRCYHVTEFSNVMARPLVEAETWPVSPDVSIEEIPPPHIDLWTLTVAQGFAEHFPVTQEILEVMKMFALGQGAHCYLARIAGKVAGGATLAIRGGIAGLFGASTLPAYRNRGVQTALLHARLQFAARAGCELAVSLALPGSASQRNIVRLDFRVLYTRVKFERACPG
jgi:GNAT superfamily N-acetyltransferase